MKFLRATLFGLLLVTLFLFALWWEPTPQPSQKAASTPVPDAAAEPEVAASEAPSASHEQNEVTAPTQKSFSSVISRFKLSAPTPDKVQDQVQAERKPEIAAPELSKAIAPKEDVSQTLVTLKAIKFQGVKTLAQHELDQVVAKFIGVSMTYEDLLRVGMVVESYYKSNNYLARVILPPQDLTDGTLHLDVIESVFSQVEVEKKLDEMPKTEDHIVGLILAQQSLGERLSNNALERGLALANEVPGAIVKGALQAGKGDSETELILTMYKGHTRQAELVYDNMGSRSTGAERLIANLTLFNPGDLGDFFNSFALKSKGSELLKFAYSIPVGFDGWRMGISTSLMKYEVIAGDMGIVGSVGQAVTQGLDLIYPWIRESYHAVTVTLSADQKKYENKSNQRVVISDYEAQVISAQVSGLMKDPQLGAVGSYWVQFSQGKLNLDGSPNKTADQMGANTAGNLSKVKVNASWEQTLDTRTSAFVSYTAQVASKNLDASEKIQLGGANGVRAYPTGEGVGSDAQLVSLELRHKLDSGVSIAGFYDWGQIRQQHDASFAGAPLNNQYSLKGLGVSVGYTTEDGVNFKATAARRVGTNPNPTQSGSDQDGTYDRNRYWLQVWVPFW